MALDGALATGLPPESNLLELDDALKRLAVLDPRKDLGGLAIYLATRRRLRIDGRVILRFDKQVSREWRRGMPGF